MFGVHLAVLAGRGVTGGGEQLDNPLCRLHPARKLGLRETSVAGVYWSPGVGMRRVPRPGSASGWQAMAGG